MADIISDYQKWKQQGEDLKTKAKQVMESRFRELADGGGVHCRGVPHRLRRTAEAAPTVTTFRFKASAKAKLKKASKQHAKTPEITHPESKDQNPDPKLARLQRRLATVKKKLEDAKAAGSPTRKLEDRIYEIEDELRLSGQPA